MLIEIRKTNFVNKGAQLMMQAIVEKASENFPKAQFCMAPHKSLSPYKKRAMEGFYQRAHFVKKGVEFGKFAFLIPKDIRNMYGIKLTKEVDVVLDAAGFAYSDQWGIERTKDAYDYIKRVKKSGGKYIFMPQALGPFENKKIAKYFRESVLMADLVYAREKASYNHLLKLVGKKDNIKLAPDFTPILKPKIPGNFDNSKNRICIVPNFKMIEKVSEKDAEKYIPFLKKCLSILMERDAKPFFLIHEGITDLKIAQQVIGESGCNCDIIEEPNPAKLKGIIGACDAMIGSRFHALVSALSQSIPVLAVGWSHKYEMLLEDYGFCQGMENIEISQNDLKNKINFIIDNRESISLEISKHAIVQKKKIESMWSDIFSLINTHN